MTDKLIFHQQTANIIQVRQKVLATPKRLYELSIAPACISRLPSNQTVQYWERSHALLWTSWHLTARYFCSQCAGIITRTGLWRTNLCILSINIQAANMKSSMKTFSKLYSKAKAFTINVKQNKQQHIFLNASSVVDNKYFLGLTILYHNKNIFNSIPDGELGPFLSLLCTIVYSIVDTNGFCSSSCCAIKTAP